MMKKLLSISLLIVLLLATAPSAFAEEAEEFTISERSVFWDMSRSWLQGYEPSISYDRLSLVVPIRSKSAADNVKAELVVENEAISPLKPQSMSAAMTWIETGLWAARFSLKCHSDRINGDYPCTIRVTGVDADGNELTTDIPYLLRIRDGRANTETARIDITDNGTVLNVGEDGVVIVTITNPCQSIILENLVLTFSDPGDEILPKGADSLPLPDLLPGGSAELSFPVTVLSSAKVAPHSLRFDFSGTALGQTVTLSESYTFPVAQEIRLEQGGLRMASSVVAGDSVTATLPLMNMGKADVLNAMATLSLPGITDRQSVLVGTIAPGETKQAQITVTAPKDALGDHSGTLTVEGEDNDGNSVSFELPVELTVEEAVKAEMPDGQESTEQKRPAAVYVLSGICGLLAVLLILQGVLLRRKIHGLEEDQL